ncbi:MAG: cytochrome c-type biogenesis protein [Solirubrobacteraceae bacterium]
MLTIAALAAIALLTAPASAATPRADLVDVEDEVMCVTCNVPLNIAESPQADDERALIRSLIEQGRTKEQIKRELVAQYGSDVLALPDRDGFGITAYLVPVALGALVLAALALLVPRWRRRPAAGIGRSVIDDGAQVLGADDAARLDADLARYES